MLRQFSSVAFKKSLKVSVRRRNICNFTQCKQKPLLVKFNQKWNEELKKLKKKIQEQFNKTKQWKNIPPPSEDQLKKGYWAFAFLLVAYGLYLMKREDAKQVGVNDILQFLRKSQSEALYIYYQEVEDHYHNKKKAKQVHKDSLYIQNQKKMRVYMYVKGEKYYTLVLNPTDFLEKVAEIQQKKNFKTKILQNDVEPFDHQIKKLFKVSVRIIIPLLIPFLLYTSSIGKIFQSKVLGKVDGARPNVFFRDIAGLGNAKIEVSELVDFLKAPQKYKEIGARIPKGALLVGPPGTGKTMLAKACAGQAEVPFYSVSGSEFVELFAGMGAHRVRDLFKNAKKQTPAIIFIDEIDAIGRKREDKFGGANDERANTLNQLLVEMDGFGTADDIIVLAATNRKEMLDTALTRPGRFDRMIEIDLPDIRGRQEILEIYLSKIKLSATQEISEYAKRIATLTFGFSGADLANLCNEAAILAVREDRPNVQPHHFQNASDRVLAGLEQTLKMDEKQKKRIAYHECGHAVTSWFLQGAAPLLKITIVPRSKGSLGFAQYLPNQATLMTKDQLLDQLCVILGGRTSEQVFFKQVTNGASDDLQKVRKLARSIVITYGMGSKHPNYAPTETDGHNIFSEKTSAEIDREVIEIIQTATQRTRKLIQTHRAKIQAMAEEVLKKQTLNHKQIREILGQRPFKSRQNYREFLEQTAIHSNKVQYL